MGFHCLTDGAEDHQEDLGEGGELFDNLHGASTETTNGFEAHFAAYKADIEQQRPFSALSELEKGKIKFGYVTCMALEHLMDFQKERIDSRWFVDEMMDSIEHDSLRRRLAPSTLAKYLGYCKVFVFFLRRNMKLNPFTDLLDWNLSCLERALAKRCASLRRESRGGR